MSLDVLVTPEAERQIDAIDTWWQANRTAAPNLFGEEPASGFELIARAPDIVTSIERRPSSASAASS